MRRVVVVVATLAVVLGLSTACPPTDPATRAFQVKSRSELIGGPRALGEVGDFILENDRARFLIQDVGFSRGFGVFGGALLDADLVRPEAGRGNSEGGEGRDNFGELFPAFFLEALEPLDVVDASTGEPLPAIEIVSAGGPGQDAIVAVRGLGGDFLALTESINETLLGDDRRVPALQFETRYILHPGAQYVEMQTTVQNISGRDIEFPKDLLGNEVPTPFGDVILFGAGNKVFVPHEAGFDMRFRLEDLYKSGTISLPAFPGLVAEFIASAGKDVSYGVMTKPVDEVDLGKGVQNFAFANKDTAFPEATDHSLHVPFIASAFTGVFQVLPPPVLERNDFTPGGNDEVKFTRVFIVGDGDVASISDVVYDLLGDQTGKLEGRVKERQRPLFVEDASVIVLDASGNKVTQAHTDGNGRFDAKLRPGEYQLVVVHEGTRTTAPIGVKITAGETAFQELFIDSPAEVVVTVVEPGVGRVPAKATLVGTSSPDFAGKETRDFLFDLSVGEKFLYTDFVPDDADDANTRRFIEAFDYGADGVVRLHGRPGTYTLVAQRGPEYDRVEQQIELVAGATKTVTMELHRVVDTAGYVSGDFHLHSQYSLDSAAKLADRITSYAGEGVEVAVSTDHNFVVDYQPVLQKLGIERFINTAIGLELTTIDRGHFNGFPLRREEGSLKDGNIASRTYGSFEWALRTPTEIFTDLRALGRKGEDGSVLPIVVQVNHPRDSILGYFDQYGLSALDLTVEGQSGLLAPDPGTHPEFAKEEFSFDFDAIEVFNGKRFEFLHTFTVPEDAPVIVSGGTSHVVDPVSCCETQVGAVLFDHAARKCRPVNGVEPDDCECNADTFNFQLEENLCGGNRQGDVAFPGVVEDWVRMLETGMHVVGTANSDSHEPEKEEPGSPRTYFAVPVDDPSQVLPGQITDAFNKGDVLMTNGPFVRVKAIGAEEGGMGSIVTAQDGRVTLEVHVETAPWVVPDVVRVYQGNEKVAEEEIPGAGAHDFSFDLPFNNDGFLIVEVAGSDSMFPTVYPNEVPPLQFTDVIGALGDSFGFGVDPNALKPAVTFVTTPYALTNPVYIDADGDDVITPTRDSPVGDASRAREEQETQVNLVRPVAWVPTEEEVRAEREEQERKAWEAIPIRKRIALSRLPRWLWPSNDAKDIRRVLIQFVRHAD